MESFKATRGRVEFGPFEFDIVARELRKHGRKIKLQDQPFEILALLLQAPGVLVTREELRHRLWPRHEFVDFEHGLNRATSKLRAALGDSCKRPRYVETVARHGYRFIASSAHNSIALSDGCKIRLAVLPFENLSGEGEKVFSDGITEEMIAQLGRLNPEQLGIIARTTAMRYKKTKKTIDQIGHELRVDYVLEGSVRRVENRVRITAKLIKVSDQTHLWTEVYDRKVTDVLAVQSECARCVRRSLAAKFSLSNQFKIATQT